jgi:hypothetical protein
MTKPTPEPLALSSHPQSQARGRAAPGGNARLAAYYLSRDRVLTLVGAEKLPPHVLGTLQGKDVAMASAILSGVVGSFLLETIAASGVKTLQQLFYENRLQAGIPFIYNGHFHGKGFGYANKTPALTLTEKLDEPLAGRKLIFEFAKDGLVNDTAYTRMSGSTRLFAFGYIREIDEETIRAIPYAVGDLVEVGSMASAPFSPALELQPDQIVQFSKMDNSWTPTKIQFNHLAHIPELAVKALICELLGEYEVPKDWGGEESDVLSSNLLIGAARKTGAFLLKGPAKFHPMTLKDCGKNGDQVYRLFNIPAQVYVVQHCHNIGAAVRKTVEAFAMQRAISAPCQYVFIDGYATARLLRAHGRWI